MSQDAAQQPMSTDLVQVLRHDSGVVELVLNRPEAMNAVSTAMARALTDAALSVAADDTTRAVVVSSSHPKAFCVGADLKERNTLTDDELRAQRPGNRTAYRSVLDLPVPVDRGRGRLRARWRLRDRPVVRPHRGLAGGDVRAARGVGGRHPRWWGYAAAHPPDRLVPGRRPHLHRAPGGRTRPPSALGIVDRVVDDPRATALELAGRIAAHSPVGVRNAKAAMRGGMDVSLAEGLDIEDARWHDTAFSADRAEGVAAFAEKRSPNWPGLSGR